MIQYQSYIVYEDGRVYSNIKNKFLKPAQCGSRREYWFLSLLINGKQKQTYIHRLVAELYVPNTENKKYVNHIDRNPSNNHYTNLEWCTAKENINHSINLGVSPIKNFREVLLYKNDVFIGEFKSKIACARYVKDHGGYMYAMDKYMFDSTGFKAIFKY